MQFALGFGVVFFASLIAVWINDNLPVGDYLVDDEQPSMAASDQSVAEPVALARR